MGWTLCFIIGLRGINVNLLCLKVYTKFFADDISKCIFLNENVYNLVQISLKFVAKGSTEEYWLR